MILGYRSYENQSSLLTHTPTIQRQTKEEPKNNREPKRDSCEEEVVRRHIAGQHEVLRLMVHRRLVGELPKSTHRTQTQKTENRTRTDQPPRPIDL